MDIKALRKSIREVVTKYKRSMLGRYTIVDCGGRKWFITYELLYYRSDWGEYDYYSSSLTQKHLLDDVVIHTTGEEKTFVVAVILNCDNKEHETHLFDLDGNKTRI